MNPERLARLISENVNEHHDEPAMEPGHFALAVNAVIAASPHGQQGEALKKLIIIANEDRGKLIDLLEKIEHRTGVDDLRYVQDFYRSQASNIMLLAKLAQAAYDNDEAVMKVLDAIKLGQVAEIEDADEDEDMYNSEGDGYSH